MVFAIERDDFGRLKDGAEVVQATSVDRISVWTVARVPKNMDAAIWAIIVLCGTAAKPIDHSLVSAFKNAELRNLHCGMEDAFFDAD